jgi:response regulator RpfG family c-di-GMP phosphodiesterase/serine/threonine protein kinase
MRSPQRDAPRLLEQLVQLGLVESSAREAFLAERFDRLREYSSDERLGHALVQAGLLTAYQVQRVLSGETHGLVLGNYRVLEELGRGGMGVVYRAEHRLLLRRVAIKVVPLGDECPTIIRDRFQGEIHVLAELYHPHIVLALDAGELPGTSRQPPLVYLVMELVEGGNLEQLVLRRGACGVVQACQFIRQAAAGLQAAHDRHLIHRDVKPSNLLLTGNALPASGSTSAQVKLVDFGLARQFFSRRTDPRALLGSVEFMPPEQSYDPSTVGKEADIYGLGATLFWLLIGEGPYPEAPHIGAALRQLQQQPPRRLRQLRPSVPPALDDLVAQMLERCPGRRPTSALAIMTALRPFLLSSGLRPALGSRPDRTALEPPDEETPRALIVADDPCARQEHREALQSLGCACWEARDWLQAFEMIRLVRFDLVLLDADLPELDAAGAGRRLRSDDNPHLEVIIAGQDGPVHRERLLARARLQLLLKAAQDRAARLADQVLHLNQQLQDGVEARRLSLREAHDAILFALARVAESRDGETPRHLKRMQEYTRVLALEAAREQPWQGLVTEPFLTQLYRCVPLHDIGKIGLPDDILLKPASLNPSERTKVETHVLVGDQILESLGREHGAALDFLGMARAIVRHHHERFDGRGYPDRLARDAIPPAARLVAIADVYDALRRMRLYKPAVSHQAAIHIMQERSEGQFDPALLRALSRCHPEFERIYRDIEE